MQRSLWAIATLTLVLSGCNSSKDTPTVAAAAAPTTAPIPMTAPAKPEREFVASGPVVVENQVDVQALREGLIVAIEAQPGTTVKKGQFLARLDDRQISADLDAASAKVRALEANLENWRAETKVLLADRSRAEKLYEAGVIPKEQLDHAVYKEEADEYEIKRESETLVNARNILRSLELEKEKTVITAPFDGIVARRYVRVGQKIAVGDRLFWVTAMGPLQVKFTLPETYFGKIRQGAQISLACPDLAPDVKVAAKIVQVSPVVDPSSGTVEVLAQVLDANAGLRPGMLVNISLNQ